MALFVAWKKKYSVGDESLDAQHKQLLGIINDLYNAMDQKAGADVVRKFLDRLVQYTISHFSYEEGVMLAHGYPEFAQHKVLHDKMRQKTLVLRDNVDLVTLRDVLGYVKEWWCDHILEQDRKYVPYLNVAVGV